MPPMLRWALKRLPLRKKERLRLEREELDAKGFVTNLERLLLAADDSANGKLAARLAGAIAGSGGKPTTILDLSDVGSRQEGGEDQSGKAKSRTNPTTKPPRSKRNGDEFETQVKTAAEARPRSKHIRTTRNPARSTSPPGSTRDRHRSGGRRSAQGLRPSGRRHRQDPQSQGRLQQGRFADHQRLRGSARRR